MRVSKAHEPSTWEDPSLVQVWGPRYNVYVVAARDLPVFTLARLPDGGQDPPQGGGSGRAPADVPRRSAHAVRRGRAGARRPRERSSLRRLDRHARDPVGRRAAPRRLDDSPARDRPCARDARAGAPLRARLRPRDAAGIRQVGRDRSPTGRRGVRRARRRAAPRTDALERRLDPRSGRSDHPRASSVRGLAPDSCRAATPTRLGITTEDRALLVPDAGRRSELWTPRVWPGALLVDGKIVGTWRRAQARMTVQTWQRLSRCGAGGGRRGGRVVAVTHDGRADGRRLGLTRPLRRVMKR